MKEIKIGIMGMGTVGSGVYRVIENEGAYIEHKEGITLTVKSVLALNYSIPIPDEKKISSIDELVADDEIDVIVEVMGGIEPAKTFITKALRAGKSVVSANKQLIANHWAELEEEAKASGAGFYFEASVGGGIPILRTVNDSLQANTITSVVSIINGTTNYILTKMTNDGASYEDVLKDAQALGYAEADPTADVDGFDCMYKLSILASMSFHCRLPIEHIYREGIRNITKEDIHYAKELGMVIKLLAIAKRRGECVELRVHPTMIPANHPLANVNDSFNAIMLHGSAVDDVMLYGRGAGDMPTASAVVSDVICASKTVEHKYMTFMNRMGKLSPTLIFNRDWLTGFYLNLHVKNVPGTLAKICSILGGKDISIDSVIQNEGGAREYTDVVIVTENARELSMQAAVSELKELEEVQAVNSLIRVER